MNRNERDRHPESAPPPRGVGRRFPVVVTAAPAVAALLAVTACPGEDRADAPAGVDLDAVDTLPADTVVEGPAVGWSGRPPVRAAPGLGEDGTTLILFETTEEFPLRFSTYFPEHLGVDLVRSGEGVAARFAGEPDELEGRVSVLAFFPTEEIQDVRAWVREVAEARGPDGVQRSDPPSREWADLEYRYRSDEAPAVRGTISLARWDDRYFYVVLQAPEGREEAAEAWVEPILSRWEWEDGTPLISDDDT